MTTESLKQTEIHETNKETNFCRNTILAVVAAIGVIIVIIAYSDIESVLFIKHQKKNANRHEETSNKIVKYDIDSEIIVLNGIPLKHPTAGTHLVWYGPYSFDEPALITQFLPVVNLSFIHHLVVYKYRKVETRKPRQRSDSDVPISALPTEIIYAWARTGQKTPIPFKTFDGSGFWVGPHTDAGSLYLDVHYEIPQNIISSNAYISMDLNIHIKKKTEQQVNNFIKCSNKNEEQYCNGDVGLAVIVLESTRFKLPPNMQDIDIVHTCKISRPVTIYAYRNHAHEAGKEFITYLFRDGIKIRELIHRNVSDAQIFYTLNEYGGIQLQTNDILQLHCHYQTIDRNYETIVGADVSKGHEMCNQYIMYYPHIINAQNICKKLRVSTTNNRHGYHGGGYMSSPFLYQYKYSNLPLPYSLGEVSGVAVSIDGNEVYIVARRKNKYNSKNIIKTNTIFVLDSKTGKVKRRFGKDLFVTPHGLACDHYGNLWVTDTSLHQIFQINSSNGNVILSLGMSGVKGLSSNLFNSPTDVVLDPKRDEVYISDGYGNCRVAVFSYNGTYLREWGNHIRGTEIGQFDIVHNVAMDVKRDQIFVADRQNCRVQIFDRFGQIIQVWKAKYLYCIHNTISSTQPWLTHLSSVAYSAHLDLVITIEGSYVVGRNPENGKQVFLFGGITVFDWPHDVDIALNEKMPSIYVAELDANRMQRFQIKTDIMMHHK